MPAHAHTPAQAHTGTRSHAHTHPPRRTRAHAHTHTRACLGAHTGPYQPSANREPPVCHTPALPPLCSGPPWARALRSLGLRRAFPGPEWRLPLTRPAGAAHARGPGRRLGSVVAGRVAAGPRVPLSTPHPGTFCTFFPRPRTRRAGRPGQAPAGGRRRGARDFLLHTILYQSRCATRRFDVYAPCDAITTMSLARTWCRTRSRHRLSAGLYIPTTCSGAGGLCP